MKRCVVLAHVAGRCTHCARDARVCTICSWSKYECNMRTTHMCVECVHDERVRDLTIVQHKEAIHDSIHNVQYACKRMQCADWREPRACPALVYVGVHRPRQAPLELYGVKAKRTSGPPLSYDHGHVRAPSYFGNGFPAWKCIFCIPNGSWNRVRR